MKRTIYECDACGSSKGSAKMPMGWGKVTIIRMGQHYPEKPTVQMFCEDCIQHVSYRAPERCPFPDTIPQPEIAA